MLSVSNAAVSFSSLTSGLRDEPLVDEELRVLGEAEEELSVRLHPVDRFNLHEDGETTVKSLFAI